MAVTDQRRAEVFSLRTPLLSEGRSDRVLVAEGGLSVRIKVYASGGENARHYHTADDHAFIVLQGRATFFTPDDEHEISVGPYQGIGIPRGVVYRFRSVGPENLVLLRVAAIEDWEANTRLGPDGEPLPGSSKKNKGAPPVPIPGVFFGD